MSATINEFEVNKHKITTIYEKGTLPIVNFQLVFQNSGSIADGNKSGLASLSAAILNEGTKKLGSTGFANLLESKAITIHTSNGFETFVIEISCLKSEEDFAFEYLKMLLADPNITQNSLDKLKNITISSLQRKESDFDFVAKKELKKIIFKDTPLENTSSGTIESVESITLKDIQNFLDKTLTLSNLIVVAGGDIELDEVHSKLKPILSTLPIGYATSLKNINAKNTKEYKEIEKDTEQAYIYFGSPFYIDSKDSNAYKAKVASFILGASGFGSRFLEEIRVKRGLAYSAYGYITINKSHSYFTGYLQTKLDNAKEAQELVKTLVSDFVKNGATEDELTHAKMFLMGSEPLRTETLSQRLGRAFTLYYRGLPLDYNEKELKLINKLTLKELNDFIKSHSEINDLSFAIVTNKGN
ncbi:M16 family metallopeptidase [Arcobacter sp. FWKO B]|uniref:M16 family metallopeptidase n=1 Tax=Arcobacter sp. FWKO B TaxID=2593672 RepID=UPI0019042240|nr:pitrilysin family protein [Arcobacter sp. FWKO B]